MRKLLAILLCKLGRLAGKLLGKGSSKPGYYALKVDPQVLKKIKLPRHIIAVSGSNGKTSTVEMIARVLTDAGLKVAYNKEGSNQIEGVTTLILSNCSLSGRMKADVLLIESDERFAQYTFSHFSPTLFVVTNLFRDQLTRNGHPNWVYDALEKGVLHADRLILNADDPLVSLYGKDRPDTCYFGADRLPGSRAESDSVYDDGRFCPACGSRMRYDYRIHNHLGNFHCFSCGYQRQTPAYRLTALDLAGGKCTVTGAEGSFTLHMPNPSLYAAYNILAAFSACSEAGVKGEVICKSLQTFVSHTGRIVTYTLGDKTGTLLTSKHENSISYDQSIAVAASSTEDCAVMVIVDAVSRKYFTSETSWFWDIDFEKLNAPHIGHIILAGTHYADLSTRFSFTDIPAENISAYRSIEEAAKALEALPEKKLYTITCFSDKDKFLNLVKHS